MKSIVIVKNEINIPLIDGHLSMIPFDLITLNGLSETLKKIASDLLYGINHIGGTAFLTVHGKKLKEGQTLRRGGPHTDGCYDRTVLDWGGGGGWKVGENGPSINSPDHHRLYNAETGGIILASNFESCLGWRGEFDGLPGVGGDCSKIKLNEPFMLDSNKVYYGNNHFIHESIPVNANVHRVFVRITMPQNHIFNQ